LYPSDDQPPKKGAWSGYANHFNIGGNLEQLKLELSHFVHR